ncbi:hypothetical protein N7492_001114 [Penicillium capsulatum]|uniref:2EXR domain-containing protein n=1 Tax=Penicillium capsulatum TaxID=69766 RepID=A0A9W9ISM0_9EURO|nr:hypothetical protein N7492_001114 [Penicillium capsulatum]KAJ6129829.1 hypothetical protein N7512_002609 [Penicillium capsulatum]
MHPKRLSKRRRTNDPEALPDLAPSLPMITQTSCPLFSMLPAELRNYIYALSLESADTLAVDDSHSLYRQNAFYYRPGYQRPKRIQTALLQTCQQIYNEASLLPPALNEHTFWFYRAPPHVKCASSPLRYFRKMSPKQRAQVQHLHFFTQQYFLDDGSWSQIWQGMQIGSAGPDLRDECRIAPTKMTITFRHTDWWYWENNEPLGMNPFRRGRTAASEMGKLGHFSNSERVWGNQFKSVPSLEELVIEFETIMRKKEQLDDIVQRALEWKFPIQADKAVYLVADPTSRSAYTWTGANEKELKHQGGPISAEDLPQSQSPDTRRVPAAPKLKPFNSQSHVESDNNRHPGLETEGEFYVVFLTWKRQVVQE